MSEVAFLSFDGPDVFDAWRSYSIHVDGIAVGCLKNAGIEGYRVYIYGTESGQLVATLPEAKLHALALLGHVGYVPPIPAIVPDNRLRFARYLYQTGRISEAGRVAA